MKKGKYSKRGVTTKAMLIILALMLLVGATVGGTIAWLTAQSETVTNTFTVGNIEIHLWENEYDLATNTLGTKKVESQTNYKIVPGATNPKNPTITVTKGSEACYLYVSIKNDLVLDGGAVATVDIKAADWSPVKTEDNTTLYRYKTTVDVLTATADLDVPVFANITYSGEDITEMNIPALDGKTVVVNAYAHQSANVEQATADAAATAWAFPAE